MRQMWNRLRAWVSGRAEIDRELAEEMQSHLEMETEGLIDRGVPPESARSAARRRAGNSTRAAEQARESWGFPWLDDVLKDIRYGFRAMRRAPAFSAVVVLTFALGVGVNAAIFSVVDTVLLKPLPYPDAERLVRLGEATAKGDFSVSWGNFQYWRDDNHSFDEITAFQGTERTLTGRGDPVSVSGMMVTSPFFSLLGMRPLMGRLMDPSDDRPGAPATTVLTQQFWARQFGGDPNIVGATVHLNGNAFEVIGVAAPQWIPWRGDYFLALGRVPQGSVQRAQHGSLRGLGRLKPGVTLASARADLDGIMRHLDESDPGPERDHHSFGMFFTEYNVDGVRSTMQVLMGAAILILLIACANVASLLLARNTARASELALRKAIGAGQFRLMRQLFTENMVLAAVGGVAGVLFAVWGVQVLLQFAPTGIPRLAQTRVDTAALLFACGTTLAAALVAGLAPVMIAGRTDVAGALKEGARSAGGGKRRQSMRNALVVAEVAITFVLAFGSGILLRSLATAQKANPGFDPRHVLTFTVNLPSKTYPTDESNGTFFQALLGSLRALPGVTDANMVECQSPSPDHGDWFYSVPGQPAPPRDQVPIAYINTADPGYFHTMRIPILQGREFQDTDRAGGLKVAVVNEELAQRWFPNEPAVGHQVKMGGPYQDGDLLQIVGVTGSVRQDGLDVDPGPEIYLPYSQRQNSRMALVLRTVGDPTKLMPAVRGTVRTLDRSLPLQHFETVEEQLGTGLARRRFSTMLLTLFAGLAMLLAGVGIYGLLNYWVTSRRPEIAIRLALGANPGRILRWTSLHALRLALIGVAIGVAAGWESAKYLKDMVFGMEARSVETLVGAALAVTLLAFLAAAAPSYRAARVDAALNLHHG